jgi:predicted enzyme related to lactoylglutathione lyase
MSETKNGKLDRRALIRAGVLGAAAAGVAVPATAEESNGDEQPGIWWNEYLADDSARAAYFYSSVVGWRMKRVALDDTSRLAGPYEKSYIMMLSGSEDTAGIMRIADAEISGARKGWFTYLQVPDVDAAVSRAVQLGGKVVHEPYNESETTRIAIIEDTEGCLVGLASTRKG